MTISLGQFLLVLLVIVLLFGNFSMILKDLAKGVKIFKQILKDKSES